jgi:hypothetical protein
LKRRAAAFIGEHGGQVYIWADLDGLTHVRTAPPKRGGDWSQQHVKGVVVNIDASAGEVTRWKIILHAYRGKTWTSCQT